jgi:hypothetical protein
MDTKYCDTCKHIRTNVASGLGRARCAISMMDLGTRFVSDTVSPNYEDWDAMRTCGLTRLDEEKCGASARWFEAKDADK